MAIMLSDGEVPVAGSLTAAGRTLAALGLFLPRSLFDRMTQSREPANHMSVWCCGIATDLPVEVARGRRKQSSTPYWTCKQSG